MFEIEKHSEIKSGQFMISMLDDSDSEKEKPEYYEELESYSPGRNSGVPAFDTLKSLFKSLSLAHVQTVSSPKWSHFKGAGFALKQKVRLNNIIWREYHMQYAKRLRPVIVKFQVPSTSAAQIKTQCRVMDGKFWNHHSNLSKEYRRWRTFFISHLRQKPSSTSAANERCMDTELPIELPAKAFYTDDKDNCIDISNFAGVDSPHFIDELMKDFDDSLDLFLNQPFPDPRDMSMLGNSDIMQPALIQLQPNCESYRGDLITGLLQQPAMPTIMEDDYASNSNYRSFTYAPQVQCSLSHQSNLSEHVSCPTFRTYASPEIALPHESECRYALAAGKQFPAPCQPPPSTTIASESIRFVDQRKESCIAGKSRNKLTLLNALLQKPSRDVRLRHHSTSSASSPETALVTASMINSGQFNRSSPCNNLIVDLSNERMASPPSGMFLEEGSTGFTQATLPTGPICDTLQQDRLLRLDASSSINTFQSSEIIHNRFSGAERLASSLFPVGGPPPQPFTTVSTIPQASRIISPYTTSHCVDPLQLHSIYRRSRSQYHPDPSPYCRPLPFGAEAYKGISGSISSAPELYTISSLSSVSTAHLDQDFPMGKRNTLVIKPSSATGVLEASEDLEASGDQGEEKETNGDNKNEDTNFDGYVVTETEVETSGIVDEDLKSSFLITPPPPIPLRMEEPVTSDTTYFPSSSAEQRRQLSMQSSLKLLQELIHQNQVDRLIREGTVSDHQTSHHQHNHHHLQQQKISKAAVLRDSAELIRSQKAIRDQLDSEIILLKAEVASLQESVNTCCDKLPTSKQHLKGVKTSARLWFRNFVATATQANWKFYIFSLVFMDVFETYHEKVYCSTSREVFRRSVGSWLEDYCDLPQLRKFVMQALCCLSTTTNVLQQPSLLPQQALEAASRLILASSPPLTPLPLPAVPKSCASSSSSVSHFLRPLIPPEPAASSCGPAVTTAFLPHT